MAYGLRTIVNSGYMPYGSGRDWFFVGDFNYRNGRRTPDANTRHKRKSGGEPVMQKRGEPKEMTQTKSIFNNSGGTGLLQRTSSKVDGRVSPVRANKWRQHIAEDTCNDVLQRSKSNTGSVHSNRWREQASSSRPVKAPLRRSASVPTPLFHSSYQDLGQLHLISDWSASDWGAAEKHRYHSSRVFPPREEQPVPRELEFRPPDWGVPHKHRYSSMPCFPPKDMQAKSELPMAATQPEWGVAEKHLYHSIKIFPPKKEVDEPR